MRVQRCKMCIQESRKSSGRAKIYHGWVFYYGDTTSIVSAITGKHKSHMWDTLPRLSKSWFRNASIPSHSVIGYLHHCMFLNTIHQKINWRYDFCLRKLTSTTRLCSCANFFSRKPADVIKECPAYSTSKKLLAIHLYDRNVSKMYDSTDVKSRNMYYGS